MCARITRKVDEVCNVFTDDAADGQADKRDECGSFM